MQPSTLNRTDAAVGIIFIALGTAMSGKLASYYDPEAESPFFIWIGLASVVVGLVVMAASRPIQRLMAGVH